MKNIFTAFIFVGFMYLILFHFPTKGYEQYKEFFQYEGQFTVKHIRDGRINTQISSESADFFFQSTDTENLLKINSGDIVTKKKNEDFFIVKVPKSNKSFKVKINKPNEELKGIPFFSSKTTPH